MSEKAPSINREEIKDIVNVDSKGRAHGNKGEYLPLSDENIKMIAAYQDKIRDGVAERQAQDGSATDSEESYSDRLKNQVGEHRTDGPLLDESERLKSKLGITEENPVEGDTTSEDDPFARIREAVSNRIDELKAGGMSESEAFGQAHDEFYGADYHKDGESEAPAEKPDGRYGFKGDDLFGGGREDMNPPAEAPSGEQPNPGYDGPVTPGMDIEPWQKPGEIEPWTPPSEVDPVVIETLRDLEGQLALATSEYARTTAKSRKSYIGRFLKNDTQVGGILAKVPGVSKLVRGWNRLKNTKGVKAFSEGIDSKVEKETLDAKADYEKAYNQLGEFTAQQLEAMGMDSELAKAYSLAGNILQDDQFEKEVAEQRESQGKSTNKFVNWWVNAKGIKGKLKKAAVVVAAGAATGLTGGLFLGATAALIAGGAAGGAIGVHVTRRRANSVNSEGMTLAQEQSAQDRAVKADLIRTRHSLDGKGNVEDLTGATEQRTDEEMLGNRRRVRTAAALGAAAGKGLYKGVKELLNPDQVKGHGHVIDKPDLPKHPEHIPKPTPENPVRGLENFNVENGNGITHELMDFAEANGHQITPEQANHLYENLLSRLGPDNILSTRTYVRDAGDIGIGQPGTASWSPEAQEILSDLLKLR